MTPCASSAKVLTIATTLLLAATVASAQSPTTILVDVDRGRLEWEWSQGTGGPADGFRTECTNAQGHVVSADLADPNARTMPLSRAIDSVGTWTCVARAYNAFGVSDPSPSVTFEAGRRPGPPNAMRLVVQ